MPLAKIVPDFHSRPSDDACRPVFHHRACRRCRLIICALMCSGGVNPHPSIARRVFEAVGGPPVGIGGPRFRWRFRASTTHKIADQGLIRCSHYSYLVQRIHGRQRSNSSCPMLHHHHLVQWVVRSKAVTQSASAPSPRPCWCWIPIRPCRHFAGVDDVICVVLMVCSGWRYRLHNSSALPKCRLHCH